jgi:hypothetical protein
LARNDADFPSPINESKAANRANKVEPQANSGILIFSLVDRALSAAINEESIDDCHGLP